MIINVKKFVKKATPVWNELEKLLDEFKINSSSVDFKKLLRLNYLYLKVSEDLVRISTLSSEEKIKAYLQSLVADAYNIIYAGTIRKKKHSLKYFISSFFSWFFYDFPKAFRHNSTAFSISLGLTLAGVVFGGLAVAVDRDAKEAFMPAEFSNHLQSPSQRVEKEIKDKGRHLNGVKSTFAAVLIKNNISVAFMTLSFGILWGIGTVLVLVFNGIVLGGIGVDYILSGETEFLLGWLLPHGVIEIPAIIIAGQAGLILADCVINPNGVSRKIKLKKKLSDVVSLVGGVIIMLIWAGFVESFFSQYHEPIISYEIKIIFGVIEFILLLFFLFQPWKRKNIKTEFKNVKT